MDQVYSFIAQHWMPLLGGYFLFMALVSGMPKPEDVPAWGKGYVWAYTSLHVLSGNVDKVFGKFLSPKENS